MKRHVASLTVLATLFVAASAQTHASDRLRLSGYGTIGYVMDDRSDIVAIRDVSQRPYSDFSRFSWRRDTRFGVQAEYTLSPELDLVGQAIVRDQVVQSVDHSVRLAYLGWKPTPQVDLRVGRVGYDAFLMSDTRNIGYAHPWVRPFTEYYGWIPIFSIDGADAAYTLQDDGGQWRIKIQGGQSRIGIPIGESELDFRATDLLGLTVNRRAGAWQFKAGYSRFRNVNEVSPGALTQLQGGLNAIAGATTDMAPAISSEAAALATQLSFKGLRMSLATVGAAYDDGRWLIQTELSYTTANHNIAPHGKSGYAVLGRRMGNWTPYVAYGRAMAGNDLRNASADWNVIGQGTTQQTAIAVLNSTRMNQATWSLGTRWDFSDDAALKLQWDHIRVGAHGYGLLFRDPALEGRSSRMNQLSITLDFLF